MADTKKALELLRDAHDTLAGMSDSDLDWFEDEEEEREAVPAQYAARKVMQAIELLSAHGVAVTPKPYAYEFGRSNGDGTYSIVIERPRMVQVAPNRWDSGTEPPTDAVPDHPVKALYEHPPTSGVPGVGANTVPHHTPMVGKDEQ